MSMNCSVDHFASYDTIYPADTVEWCPIPKYNNVLVCGTYKLDEANKSKTGTINLFTLDNEKKIKLVQSVSEDAVLDLKWNPFIVSGQILLAAALSGKHVSIYCLGEFSINNNQKTIHIVNCYIF
jgi:diphthine methyl ester acylhydrolase